MRTILKFVLLFLFACCCQPVGARDTLDLGQSWSFARFGPMPDGSHLEEPFGLEQPDADDSEWRVLNVPHDWGIEGPFREDLPNRTGKLPWPGIGWYRKTVESPETDEGKKIYIQFDGAMSDTTLWVNGTKVGRWPYGYTSFQFDITEPWNVGQSNTIAVRLDNKPESSRWYPGGGIYRNVRLIKTHPVHVGQWGVFVTTPEVKRERATIQVQTELIGSGEVRHDVREFGGNEVLATGVGESCEIDLEHPRLWRLDSPQLYELETVTSVDGHAVDRVKTTFGIRTIEYTEDGFFLNGEKTHMNGVCMHSDLGPLGMAVHKPAMRRQIEILKSFGCNAIRTAHNPPAPEYLDLCDQMGMLVQVEAFDCWKRAKADNDYARFFDQWHERDLRAMVRRDRNHPCVVMWSTGNELVELRYLEDAPMLEMLADIVRDEDPTRPSTLGCSIAEAAINGWVEGVELLGINYKPHMYEEIRAKNPGVPLYGSETASMIASRGEYFFPVSNVQREGVGGDFQVSSYGNFATPNGYPAMVEFEAQRQHPFVFGNFVWTGFDYIGEPTPFNKDKTNLLNYANPVERARVKAEMKRLGNSIPPRSSYFGIVDLCGFPKDSYYLYQSHWRPDLPMAHLLPHWNWPDREGEITPVHVYTSGDEAELFLNGKSLGRKKKVPSEYRLCWDDVTYMPGKLSVVAYKDGDPWALDVMETTGEASKLILTADRNQIAADGSELCFLTVQVTDDHSRTVPRTHNRVNYAITGPGEIVAIGNGDPTDLTSFQSLSRRVFNGLALVIVRSSKGEVGEIVIKAQADGLAPATIVIKSDMPVRQK